MGAIFKEHQWPQEQSGTIRFHCFHKKPPNLFHNTWHGHYYSGWVIQASVAWQEIYMYSLKPEFISVLYLNDHAHNFMSGLQQPINRINLQNNSSCTSRNTF